MSTGQSPKVDPLAAMKVEIQDELREWEKVGKTTANIDIPVDKLFFHLIRLDVIISALVDNKILDETELNMKLHTQYLKALREIREANETVVKQARIKAGMQVPLFGPDGKTILN